MVATELLKLAMETEEGRKERLKKMVANHSAEARPSLVPRPFYARGARWERDKGLVPVVRACVNFYWNPGKIVFFGIF